MKKILFIVLTFSLNVFAGNSSIEVSSDNGGVVTIDWLGNTADESEAERLWELGAEEALLFGELCFNGRRSDAIKILKYLDKVDILGDELSLINFKYKGKDQFSYEVYDGPNGEITEKNYISACK